MEKNQTKFNLIYGRSGTGKTEYIYRDIDKKLKKYKNIYIIVPEQSSLISEKKFFEITGKDSMLNVEVLTLSRMAYRIELEIGSKKDHLSKVGKSMLIYDLLNKNKKNLKFLGKSDKNVEVVEKLFTELKKHNITIDDLNKLNIADQYTSLKVEDIKLLYENYEKYLSDKFIDENDELMVLANNIKKSNIFENSSIYIDEFFGFTPQEYLIFEELIKKCDEISVSVCLDKLETDKGKESDIFYFNRKYVQKLLEISERENCKLNLVNLDEPHRFKNKELMILEKNLSGKYEPYYNKTENIELFLTNNAYSEIENIAQQIYNLVKNDKYKYREIGIVANDIDEYAEDSKAIFQKYEIPIFIDEKKDLNQNILIKYILALLDIFNSNWSYDAMFNYLKIGILDIDYYDICLLENYCQKWGIRGNKWYKSEFNYEKLEQFLGNQEKLEMLRKQIVKPILKFKENFSKEKTVKELNKNIYEFLLENKIIENLDKKIKSSESIEISNEYNTSYKILLNIFDDMVLLFGDKKVDFEKYRDLLMCGIKASELGKIPASQDQVILGDIDRTRNNKIKVLFVVGMNDGMFPKTNKQEGYLNDNDRIILEENGIELAKTSIDAVYESQFNIYRTLTIPEEKLYLSFCLTDKEGGSLRPSIMIKKLKRIFTKLTEKSDVVEKKYIVTNEKATLENALEKYKEFLDGNEIEENWKDILIYFYNKNKKSFSKAVSGLKYTNKSEKISLKNIRKLYGNNLKTTISRLESYRRCPFSFHMIYGLKIDERETYKIDSLDTGSFMHEVIDSFFNYLESENLSVKTISEDELENIINEIIDEQLQISKYYKFSSSAKFRMLTRKLKQVVVNSIKYIVYTLKYSDFKPLGHELEFGKGKEYEPIILDLEDGQKIEIEGKIDRVDVGKLDDKEYVRIIDYKSSVKTLDLNQVIAGLQIQLITYLDAIEEQKEIQPAGVLYLPLIKDMVKNPKIKFDEEKLKIELRKQFKMKGLILADINIVRMMDNNLVNGYSQILPIQIVKNEEFGQHSSIATKEEFSNLQKKVKSTIKEISKEILSGNIDIKPYSYKNQTGCSYCKYKSICMFNPNLPDNDYYYIKHKNSAEILNDLEQA